MCYTNDELNRIIEDVEKKDMFAKYLRRLNAEGTINEFLNDLGYQKDDGRILPANRSGKILVIGGTNVRRSDLEMTARKSGYDKARFEWVLNYAEAKKYPFRSLQYNENYAAVMVGPMPHKCCYETDYASVVTAMMNEPGFPPVLRLEKGTKLSITKENFTKALREMQASGIA